METLFLALGCGVIGLFIYYLSYLEPALFTMRSQEKNEFSISESRIILWLIQRLENPRELEIFFGLCRGVLIVLLFLTFDRILVVLGAANAVRWIIDVAVLSVFILLVGKLFPVVSAVCSTKKHPTAIWLFYGLFYIFYPLTFTAKLLLIPIIGKDREKSLLQLITEHQFQSLIPDDSSISELEAPQRRMIRHIVEFGDTTVREIMVPRIDMVSVEEGTPLWDVVRTISESGHSRIPLYREKVDNIIGILYSKDILIALPEDDNNNIDLATIARRAYFVPEAKPIDDLLAEFRSTRNHIAIVVDEYGGVAGLVTMEDILEEIVGEIQDEYDQEEMPITRLSQDVYLIEGKTPIDEINEQLDISLPEEDFDSLGGLIYQRIGAVPEAGQKLELPDAGVMLIVEKLDGHRIEKIKLIVKEPQEKEANNK